MLKRGDVGVTVEAWQRMLVSLGYSVKTDCIFGAKTERATWEFQQTCGLPATGVVDHELVRRATMMRANCGKVSTDGKKVEFCICNMCGKSKEPQMVAKGKIRLPESDEHVFDKSALVEIRHVIICSMCAEKIHKTIENKKPGETPAEEIAWMSPTWEEP